MDRMKENFDRLFTTLARIESRVMCINDRQLKLLDLLQLPGLESQHNFRLELEAKRAAQEREDQRES